MRIKSHHISFVLAIGLFYVFYSIINLEIPKDVREHIEKEPRVLSQVEDKVKTFDHESVLCLAKNAYFEARNQSILSQIAVSQVVMNRVKNEDFPNTVCGVVYEAWMNKWFKDNMNKDVPVRDKCQFSWYCDGKADVIHDHESFNIALAVANQVLSGYNLKDVTDGALWYHAVYVNPYWAKEKIKTVKHEDHIFYKE